MAQRIFFLILIILAFSWAFRQYAKIYRNIRLGKAERIEGNEGQRWKNLLLIAFGQKKMFKGPLVALFHFAIYAAFIITQVELFEIFVDGFVGTHRIFAPYLGGFYTLVINTIEILSLLALGATVIFLARRNLLKIPRFWKAEMTIWPHLDANLILLGEILLIIGIFSMNGADVVLQGRDPLHYPETGHLLISDFMGPLLLDGLSTDFLIFIERTGWWLHLIVVLAFLNYLPYSKHLHILLAFPNVYYQKLKPRGEMENVPEITTEIKSMLGMDSGEPVEVSDEIPEFGVKDIFDLSWKNLLDAYTCTECGRCTAVCPANITGKKLSPRKIVMDIRDRMEEVGQKIDTGREIYIYPEKRNDGHRLNALNFNDGESLFDRITDEELFACTACQACVEACPVQINPLEPILEMRRFRILNESKGPSDWMPMFTSLENKGSVWQMAEERDAWTKGDS